MWAAATAAAGDSAPAGGLSSGDAPPFLFCLAKRETGRARSKEKSVRRAPVQWPSARRGSAYRCLLRFCLAFGHAWVFCEVDTAVPWRGFRPRRGARTHLTSFSFRAFRFATRCPGGRRSCCVGSCWDSHRPPASGSENRRSVYPRPPRAKGFPKGSAFPSLTSTRECQPSPAGGRRSALAQTDPPNIFSFPPGAAQKVNCPAGAREAPLEGFLFDVFMRGPHRAPRGGERRSKGAGAVFAAGGNRAERTLRRRQWGAHPAWKMPPAGAEPPWPTSGGPNLPRGGVIFQASPVPASRSAPGGRRCRWCPPPALRLPPPR